MEQNITLQIDNHIVEVAKGTTILEAARGVGIQIPSLCYMNLKDMCITNLPASCRMCRRSRRTEKPGSGLCYQL